jgi:hypothetical protein
MPCPAFHDRLASWRTSPPGFKLCYDTTISMLGVILNIDCLTYRALRIVTLLSQVLGSQVGISPLVMGTKVLTYGYLRSLGP